MVKTSPAPPPAKWSPSWMWLQLKETALHYYHGSKLLAADTRIAAKLMRRMFFGRTLSRREHKLLVRVFADIARLVPLSFFVIVPMMEFALPFAIRLFPNLLPSTFEERHHVEEKKKKLLKVRMDMAQVLQHTLDERATQVAQEARAKQQAREEDERREREANMTLVERRVEELRKQFTPDDRVNADVREFMMRMKEGGRAASSKELIAMMSGFKDNITLDHLYRDQLVAMAKFLNMNHYAPTALLRFQLRQRLKRLRGEDKEIHWEGVTGLSDVELQQDLRNRGLPTAGLTTGEMKDALQGWITLSQKKEIPYSLLILTNMLHFADTRHGQKQAMASQSAAEEDQASPIPLDAAEAAMSSLPSIMAAKSTLVTSMTDDEKLEALRHEEALVEEERAVLESEVDKLEDRFFDPDEKDELRDEPTKMAKAAAKAAKAAAAKEAAMAVAKAAKAEAKRKTAEVEADTRAAEVSTTNEGAKNVEDSFERAVKESRLEVDQADDVDDVEEEVKLTREQIADLAEAIDTMIDSPIGLEKEGMAELEAERVANAELYQEATSKSKTTAFLDSRVKSMLERLRAEMDSSEQTIGEAFHKLDLDGDGMVSHEELLLAIDNIHLSKRPNTKAFVDLLIKMDIDADGKISVEDVRKLVKGMRTITDDDDDDDSNDVEAGRRGAASA